MGTNLFILAGLLVVIVLLGIIGILSRYRKCKSDEVLVVYGKTGGSKSAKLYHGGAAFVWPIIQGYDFLSMKPMQIDCKLTGAISAQNIRVDVPTTITVAISTDPEVMQNAAERMLGLSMDDKQNLITDVVYGQMRLVIADMTIEELNSDRDKFLAKVKDNIDTELRKFGLYLMNINISDIRDAANYIVNLGKEAESKAQNEAQKEIALSNAQLSVTQANADKEAGEAAARSEAAVQTARERAQKEVEEAKAMKVESSLKAEKIVPAEVAKQEAILQADAVAEKVIREAEAKAKATLAQAEAEAKAIRMRLEAEAEGKKMSLLAEADGFQAMVKAAELNPAIAIQYKMVDQWKEIAGEQVKAFEKMQLGNVTVFDGGDGATGNFLNSLVKTVAPSLGVLDQLPIGETVKKILHPEKKDEGTEKKDEK